MDRKKGVLFGMLASIIYGLTPVLGKKTFLEGSNAISLTFYRSFISLPFSCNLLKHKNIPIKTGKSDIKKIAILAFLASLTTVSLYGAYNYLSTGMSTTIHYIYPVIVTILSALIYKDRVGKKTLCSLVLSMIGISMFIEGNINLIGISLSLISGITFASYLLHMDKGGLRDMYPFKVSFLMAVFVSCYIFVFGVITKTLVFKMTLIGWFYTMLVAISIGFLANTLIFLSVKYVSATITGIVGMFEPTTSIIFGIIFLKEPITVKNILACILILMGVFIEVTSKEEIGTNINKTANDPNIY